jgi:hypothetical protein
MNNVSICPEELFSCLEMSVSTRKEILREITKVTYNF